MTLNEEVKAGLSNIKKADECLGYLRKSLLKYTTLFNVSYSDYEQRSFTQQVKGYKGSDKDYVIVMTDFEDNKVNEVKVIFAKEEPRKPHPLFPLIKSITRSNDIHEFFN